MNIYSETFFKVNEDKTKLSDSTKLDKPWLNEMFPEYNANSANDLCFNNDGVICLMLLHNTTPDDSYRLMFEDLKDFAAPKIDRGIRYKFGWINCKEQQNFCKTIEVSSNVHNKIALINPGKRKRYYVAEEEIGRNKDKISILFIKNTYLSRYLEERLGLNSFQIIQSLTLINY